MDIIIGNKNERFKPHYNRTTGKRYHTAREYVTDIKAKGLEPFRGEVSRKSPKPYKPSEQARAMVESLGKHKPGDRYMKALNEMGKVKAVPKNIRDKNEGGFYSG